MLWLVDTSGCRTLHGQELKVLPDQIGIAKTEGGMVLAQLNQTLIVLNTCG